MGGQSICLQVGGMPATSRSGSLMEEIANSTANQHMRERMWNHSLLGAARRYASTPVLIVVAAVLVGAIALTGIRFATTGDTISDEVFPEKLPVQAELHDGEILRNVEFYPDGVTPKHAFAYNNDGTLTDYWYREDGTLERAESFWQNEDGSRIVLRRAEFLPDGVTYKYDIEYFADGIARAKELVLIDDNRQHRQFFWPNGVVRLDQVILRDQKGWKLKSRWEYREDASTLSRYEAGDNDSFEEWIHSEKGLLITYKKKTAWGGSYTEENYGGEDGNTVMRRMTQNHMSTKVETFDTSGKPLEERVWFGAIETGMMNVTVFDDAGKKRFYQSYMPKDGKPRLYVITEFKPDGKDGRNFYFQQDGAISETVYNEDGSKWTRRLFRPDGTLAEEIDMEKGKGKVGTRQYEESADIRVQIPQEYLVFRPFTAPDQIIPYIPQGPY